MATKLTLVIAADDAGAGAKVFVAESFDEVMEKVQPLQAPSSALEHRANLTYTKADDSGRLFIPAQHIGWAEENAEEDA